MKMTLADWPVLIVSAEFTAGNNEGHRLRELLEELKKNSGCTVITSASYEDALEIFTSRADIGCVVADWDLEFEKKSEKMSPENMLDRIRMRNLKIPVILVGYFVAEILYTDYAGLGVICIMVIYLFRQNRIIQAFSGAVAFMWEIPAPLAFVPVAFYNGKRGWKMKYFFYIFYPAHLLLLYLMAYFFVLT